MADNTPITPPVETTVKTLTVDGYSFEADTDLMDDVEAFEHIDRIENKGQIAAIVPLITYMIGVQGYNAMKEYFTEKDGKDHAAELEKAGKPADPNYKPRFRMMKLQEVYMAIAEHFNPKG